MKTFTSLRFLDLAMARRMAIGAAMLAAMPFQASAQYFERVYANSAPGQFQGGGVSSLGVVTDRENALATNGVTDYSTLTVPVAVAGLTNAVQVIKFGTAPSAGTALTVKVETGSSILGLVDYLQVQAMSGNTEVGEPITGASLLGLLGGGVLSDGTNVAEVTFVPRNAGGTSVAYDGVKLTLSAAVGVGLTTKFYHAYYLKPVTTAVNCDAPVDAVYGVGAGVASLLAGVLNPYAAITGSSPATQIFTGATVGGSVSETVLFAGPAAGDALVTLSIPPTLLSLDLLDAIVLEAYNGSTSVGSRTLSSLLDLDLLGLFNNGNQITLRLPTTAAFDRVTIKTVALISALSNLNIHSVKRVLPVPSVTIGNNDLIYLGQTANLTATSIHQTDNITWYNGLTSVGTGASLNVSPTETTSYTVDSNLPGCTTKSGKGTAVVTVLPLPTQNTLSVAVKATTYSATVATNPTSGRALSFASADFPTQTGLTLNSSTGEISGTPTVDGTFNFSVLISDAGPASSGARVADIGNTPALGAITTYNYSLTINNSLPVKLASFSARKEGNISTLAWSTTSEVNSERFDIERKIEGNNWTLIGSKAAAGDKSDAVDYTFVDQNPANGENLYRLKMIDRDGSFAYSGIQSLSFKLNQITVSPNPVSGSEQIKIQVGDWGLVSSVRVLNALGQVVFQSTQEASSYVSADQLKAGLYIVQVTRKDGQKVSSKFVKL